MDGGEEELTQHLNNMGDVALALGPQSQYYILHIAKRCHHIPTLLRVHVSQWVIRQGRENRENKVWVRHFISSLSNDVLLLWNVFRMPCLALVETSYAKATRSGCVKDIVQASKDLVNAGETLPDVMRESKSELHQ